MNKLREVLLKALEVLERNHKWHEVHDEFDGYQESDLCERNRKTIEELRVATAAPPEPNKLVASFARACVWGTAYERSTLGEQIEALLQPSLEKVGTIYRYGRDSAGKKWHGVSVDAGADLPEGTVLYAEKKP